MELTIGKSKRKTARRGNGEGSICQYADGRWCARVTIGRSDTGKRKVKAVYGWTKTEVQEKLSKIQSQKQDGTLSSCGRMTLGAFLEAWLQSLSLCNKPRASTVASYRQIIEKHVMPTLGGSQLASLTPGNVKALYLAMKDRGKSPRLVEMVHTVLHRAMKRAVIEGLVPRNVCAAVERPGAEKSEMQCLDPDQARSFLKATEADRLHAMYVLAVYAGLRQGEIFGLRRDDLELEADKGSVMVRRTLVELNGKFTVGPPKSKAGTRRVKFGATVARALHDHVKRMMAEGNASAGYLFCDRRGGPLRRQNVLRRSFRPALEAAKLPTVRFHDLRHTCATIALLAGVHVKTVSSMLGHSKISVTLDLYAHVLDSMTDDAADKMEDVLAVTKTG
jgi:integrase